jgi:hypothetical protein
LESSLFSYLGLLLQLSTIFNPCSQLHRRGQIVQLYEAILYIRGSRDSAVSIATGYGLDGRGVRIRFPVGSRIFSTASRPALGPTHPPIQWVLPALSSGVKRPGCETGQSPSNAEVKNDEVILPLPICHHDVVLN